MKKADKNALISIPTVIFIGLGAAFAGSQGDSTVAGLPLFGLLVGLIFLIQWVAFIPAYLLQSEKFFDLTGSLTYILVTVMAAFWGPTIDGRSILLLLVVVIWAVRLGTFLFRRVHRAGKDGRFDEIKPSFFRFLNFWTIQGLWITFTAAAALVGITTSNRKELGALALIGFLIWLIGFAIEIVADQQKSRFKGDPDNRDKFILTGLWSRSRHPNYFGEIVLWVGVLVMTLPVLQGWQWFALISPVFVAVLLLRVSGIPILEQRADEKWGGQPDYETYKKNTPVLIPRILPGLK